MGEQNVSEESKAAQIRQFTKRILEDLRALQQLLQEDVWDVGVRRIGAEQEMFLVDKSWRPAPVNLQILEKLDGRFFTTELGRFNLEFNLDPLIFGGRCLSRLETQLNQRLEEVRAAAADCDAEVVLTGILPTLEKRDVNLENMTPIPRYYALNRAMNQLRGGHYDIFIEGIDELQLRHDSVMLEACNTSFQVHFQVAPAEFAKLHNIAQAVAGPVLAAATNAPLLFGQQLWRETRIALFQQSIDTRTATLREREAPTRVSFGQDWLESSVLEIFQEDIARFRVLLAADHIREDPFQAIREGRAPLLQALQLHNGTIYRWNRACYGITDGKPHLRIENRILPAGPSVIDQVANAAFWFGLMSAIIEEYGDITKVMRFEQAKSNFVSAARLGLRAQFRWLDDRTVPAGKLIRQRLLPSAREGLRVAGVDSDDISRYLDVLEQRVRREQTGAQWLVDSLENLRGKGNRAERLRSLTAATVARQKAGDPVHTWPLAELHEAGDWRESYTRVGQYMTTDLITVHGDEPLDLVAHLMDWKRIRHIPVEDHRHRLLGVVSERSLLRYLAFERHADDEDPVPVRDIMSTYLITATPDMHTLDAIALMREHEISCLPVLDPETDTLVGVVTDVDFLVISENLIEEKLADDDHPGASGRSPSGRTKAVEPDG